MEDLSIVQQKLNDIAIKANRTNISTFSCFLSPTESAMVANLARLNKVNFNLFGGYENAERLVAEFFVDDVSPFPIACLQIKTKAKTPEHRQIMGTILSLGLKRDVLGDIVFDNNNAYVFCLEHIANYIKDNILKIANIGVEISVIDFIPQLQKISGEQKRFTIASIRCCCFKLFKPFKSKGANFNKPRFS